MRHINVITAIGRWEKVPPNQLQAMSIALASEWLINISLGNDTLILPPYLVMVIVRYNIAS
jgi:hypothetical protein